MSVRRLVLGLVLGAASALLNLACGESSAEVELDHSILPVEVQALQGRVLLADSLLGLPINLESSGDQLVISDILGLSPVQIVNRHDGLREASYGRRGEGPGEFLRPAAIHATTGPGQGFWVHDLRLQRLTKLEPQHLRGEGPEPLIVRLEGARYLTGAVSRDGGGWVGAGLFGDGRLALYETDGTFSRYAGSVPGDTATIPTDVLLHAYQSILRSDPLGRRLVLATRLAGQIDIFDRTGTHLYSLATPFPFKPRFTVQLRNSRPVMITDEDTRYGYVDLDVSPERTYALFSGRTERGFPNGANFGEYIHVFDSAGQLLSVLRLDRDAIAIAVDHAEENLYTAIHEPSPAIVAYTLPFHR